jgi:hypothetical protein
MQRYEREIIELLEQLNIDDLGRRTATAKVLNGIFRMGGWAVLNGGIMLLFAGLFVMRLYPGLGWLVVLLSFGGFSLALTAFLLFILSGRAG